jgi:hypothetical protein
LEKHTQVCPSFSTLHNIFYSIFINFIINKLRYQQFYPYPQSERLWAGVYKRREQNFSVEFGDKPFPRKQRYAKASTLPPYDENGLSPVCTAPTAMTAKILLMLFA